MEALNEFWQIIVGVITPIIVLSKMHLDIEIIKDKIKTLFNIINRKDKE